MFLRKRDRRIIKGKGIKEMGLIKDLNNLKKRERK